MSSITLKLPYATILLPQTGDGNNCIGCVKTGNRRCRNRIRWETWQRGQMNIINMVHRSTNDNTYRDDVLRVIRTLLCYLHRDSQASAIFETFEEGLNSSAYRNPSRGIEAAVERVGALERTYTIQPFNIIKSRAAEKPVRQVPETTENAITREVQGLVGFIYMFRYPGEEGYLKIGYSKNVESRMRQIARACDRVPIVIAGYRQRPIQSIREAESMILRG
jgi:hypothetical protein